MTSTSTPATSAAHTITVKSWCNGGAKARRWTCSCGDFGSRVAYGPGLRTLADATARAEAQGAEHAAS